jgi:hypothetical protein
MSRAMNKDQLAELELLREESGGNLDPRRIVEFARSSNTALHSAFTWDDGEAAERWRINQAKQVIRAAVTMLPRPDGGMVPVRAYVYDATARQYAATSTVLSDAESADTLLRQMRLDVERILNRYRRHASLVPHIAAALSAIPTTLDQ